MDSPTPPILFSAAVSEFLAALSGIRSPHTIAWYRNVLASLGEYLGDRPITQIETRDLRQWRTRLSNRTTRWEDHPTRPNKAGKLSPWTVHDHVRAVRRFFGWLESEGMIESSPAKRLELPPLPDGPTKGISTPNVQKMLISCGRLVRGSMDDALPMRRPTMLRSLPRARGGRATREAERLFFLRAKPGRRLPGLLFRLPAAACKRALAALVFVELAQDIAGLAWFV